MHPFFTDKSVKSSENIQLLKGDTLVTKPIDVANVINEFFTNITSTIGEPVSEATLELDDEEFILLIYDKYKDHPSVKYIAENHQLQSNFEFKEVSPDLVQSTLSKLNPAKATGYDKIPPKVLKIAAPVIANPIASIINNSIRTAKFPLDCKHAEIGPIQKKDEFLL